MKASKLALSVLAAAEHYIKLRDRDMHPAGNVDSAGRFFLDRRYECCRGIRSPSRNYPFSEMVHARTVLHVACELKLSDYIKAIRKVSGVLDKSGEEAAREMIVSKPFVKTLITITNDVKAAKAATRAAKAARAATLLVEPCGKGNDCDCGVGVGVGVGCEIPF